MLVRANILLASIVTNRCLRPLFAHLPTHLSAIYLHTKYSSTYLHTKYSMKPPTTPQKQKNLSRDSRLKVQTLREIGWTYFKIAEHLKIILRQVQYACSMRLTPQKKRCGRKACIDVESLQMLAEFVCASTENRQMPYRAIPWKLGWDVTEDAIRSALKKEGFFRRIARRKPPISEKNRLLRLAWAHEHLNWIKEQ